MNTEVKGTIEDIFEINQITDSFKKRELVIKTEGDYPQEILIQFTQDRCDALNGYKTGDGVSVAVNLRGRSWVNPDGVTKYFNSVEGWRIDKVEQGGKEEAFVADEEDDLPF